MTSTSFELALVVDVALDDQDRRASAWVDVPASSPLFDSHFPRRPVLPGVLILQAVSDLALNYASGRPPGTWRLAALRAVKLRRPVSPGARMTIAVVETSLGPEELHLAATVTVEGQVALRVGQLVLKPLMRLAP